VVDERTKDGGMILTGEKSITSLRSPEVPQRGVRDRTSVSAVKAILKYTRNESKYMIERLQE
jgi:hypothetical protein